MIKTEVKLKNINDVTMDDNIGMIDTIVHYIIGIDIHGNPYYRPYNREAAKNMAIALYLVEGYEFDDNDEDSQKYSLIVSDNDIMRHVGNAKGMIDYKIILDYVDSMVDDIVEFQKQVVPHNNPIINEKMFELINTQKQFEDLKLEIALKQKKLLEQQIEMSQRSQDAMEKLSPETLTKLFEKLANDEYNVEDLAQNIVSEYFNSDAHMDSKDELIESQQNKIAELSKYKKINDAKNVLADVKGE